MCERNIRYELFLQNNKGRWRYLVKEDMGLVHIYCGDGKGKSTAALGIILRSIGCGYKVVLAQFLKEGDSSELKPLSTFNNIKIISGQGGVKGFAKFMTDENKEVVKKAHIRHFKEAINYCIDEKCDLLVLDEIIGAINVGLIDYDMVIDFLRNKPENLEVIMTGRDPKEELLEMADYVSEVKKIKHPFDKGIGARYGIEK